MPTFQRHATFSTRTSPLNSYGIQRQGSGIKGSREVLLAACTMPIQVLVNASIFVPCFVLSKALHHLRIYEVLTVSYIQPFMLHVSHEAYWRTITSGDNVFKKLLIWQAVTSCATFSSPFFAIALHQILWLFGWNLEPTFVTTSTTLSNPEPLSTIPQKSKYLIMASTSSIVFFVLATRNWDTGQPCLFLSSIGI